QNKLRIAPRTKIKHFLHYFDTGPFPGGYDRGMRFATEVARAAQAGILPSRMNDRLRWGILGTGNIARQFADGVHGSARRGVIVGIGSRSPDAANAFAGSREITNVHGS